MKCLFPISYMCFVYGKYVGEILHTCNVHAVCCVKIYNLYAADFVQVKLYLVCIICVAFMLRCTTAIVYTMWQSYPFGLYIYDI